MFAAQEKIEIGLPPDARSWTGTIQYCDGQHLVVAIGDKDFARLNVGAEVRLVQLINDNVYQLAGPVLRFKDNAFVIAMKQPLVVDCRRNRRYPCNLPAWYKLKLPANPSEPRVGAARAIDVSMSGSRLFVDTRLDVGIPVTVGLDLTRDEPAEIDGEIMKCVARTVSPEDREGSLPFTAGVRFTGLTRAQKILIQRFIGQSFDPTSPARTPSPSGSWTAGNAADRRN